MHVPDELLGRNPCYALEVRGDSMMIGLGESANNGEIAVALVRNEEVTLKRIEQKRGRVILNPANASMELMEFLSMDG